MSSETKIKNIQYEQNTLPIKKFNLDNIKPGSIICMIAKRNSGKSWVCREILYQLRHLPCGIIICPTDKMSKFYGKFFPDLYIHYEYDDELVENILTRQEMMIEKMRKYYKQNKKVDPRCVFLMDDCLSSVKIWSKSQNIKEIFMNGRHYQLTYILTMQDVMGVQPEFRSNIDYIFLFKDHFISNQEKIHKHYAGMFPDKNSFKQIFNKITTNFCCMVIDQTINVENPLEKVFWFKAKEIKDIRFGDNQFNNYCKKNYNKKWNKGKFLDYRNIADKKKRPTNIQISKMDY